VIEIQALRWSDDRARVRFDDADPDHFFSSGIFRQFPGQNQFRHPMGVTYVALDDQHILGFATVAAAHVEIDGLPAAAQQRLPEYPLPVLRLARLAVDRSAQGQGFGLQLLRFVLQLALRMSDDFGCVSIRAVKHAVG
jgi:GNAT superfamily N-acetyltransferase